MSDKVIYLVCALLVLFVILYVNTYITEAKEVHRQEISKAYSIIADLREINAALREDKGKLQMENRNLRELTRMFQRKTLFRALYADRDGKRLDPDVNIFTRSGFTSEELERAFRAFPGGEMMQGLGEVFTASEQSFGINALVLVGIVVHESDWGQSKIARDKNNLAGIGACDGAAYEKAKTYPTKADSIRDLARLFSVEYAPGGRFFNGQPGLKGIGEKYASDPHWADKVLSIMRIIVEYITEGESQ